MRTLFYSILFISVAVLSQTGCGPTYPKEIVGEAIAVLCREDYNLDVKVKIIGKTVGVYIPIEGLFDPTLNISQEAVNKIDDVIEGVSRVTLSTDAPLDFYIVIAQDTKLPGIEVVLIRYVNDLKLYYYQQISRDESRQRMIIESKLTPQAQKEKVLRDIFGRLNITDADELINEYLRTSGVVSIGDIGYWQDTFYIKDIGIGEFLGMQTADRVRLQCATTDSLAKTFKLNLLKGGYLEEGGRKFFRFSFDVSSADEEKPFLGPEDTEKIFGVILEEASAVFDGYKFSDFWNIEIVNEKDRMVLFASAAEIEEFRKKKMKIEEFRRWYR